MIISSDKKITNLGGEMKFDELKQHRTMDEYHASHISNEEQESSKNDL